MQHRTRRERVTPHEAPIILSAEMSEPRFEQAVGGAARNRQLHFTKREFSYFAGDLRSKVRERHADEPNAFRGREHGPDQVQGDLMQLLPRLDRHFHRPAASGYLKVGPFDLHRERPATRVRFLAPSPDIIGHRDYTGLDLNGISLVLRESRLRAQ